MAQTSTAFPSARLDLRLWGLLRPSAVLLPGAIAVSARALLLLSLRSLLGFRALLLGVGDAAEGQQRCGGGSYRQLPQVRGSCAHDSPLRRRFPVYGGVFCAYMEIGLPHFRLVWTP